MNIEWLQVPEDFRTSRCRALALLLSKAGKRTSDGDAFKAAVDLWGWCIQQVDGRSADLAMAFNVATYLPRDAAPEWVSMATGWRRKWGCALVEAMSHSSVQILGPEGDGWRVLHIAERYLALATKQQDGRARAQLSVLANEHGWEPDNGRKGSWRHKVTGERGVPWRELLARLGGTHV